jgi:Zn/Cd-binding protein ZinT
MFNQLFTSFLPSSLAYINRDREQRENEKKIRDDVKEVTKEINDKVKAQWVGKSLSLFVKNDYSDEVMDKTIKNLTKNQWILSYKRYYDKNYRCDRCLVEVKTDELCGY